MVSKNLKYVLMLSGVLAVAPVTADSGRKLGALQKIGVATLGVQADQATFGKMAGNGMLTLFARGLSQKANLPQPLVKLAFKYIIRLLNAHDGIVGTIVNGTKDALLTGTVEDLIKQFAGKIPADLSSPEARIGGKELSKSLKIACAAITAARSVYVMRVAQTVLAQVEDECSKLGIESGVQKGLVPTDDSYLVIDNPFKSLAVGARQINASFASYKEPLFDIDAWEKSLTQLEKEAYERARDNDPDTAFINSYTGKKIPFSEIKKMQENGSLPPAIAGLFALNRLSFFMKYSGNIDIDKRNATKVNPTQQKIGTALWAPFALTHFVGRTMIPYDTIKQLSPELQQALLDLAAFNTVNFYSFLV